MIIINFKIEVVYKKTNERTQILFLPLSLIIGYFTLIFKRGCTYMYFLRLHTYDTENVHSPVSIVVVSFDIWVNWPIIKFKGMIII